MLSSAKRSVPTSKQFRQPYFMDIAPDGAVLSACDRFALLLAKNGIPDFTGHHFLRLFSRIGTIDQDGITDRQQESSPKSIDLFVQSPDTRSFIIRWIMAPQYGVDPKEGGWQLTGTKIYTQESPDILITADPEGRVVSWNHAAERFYQLSSGNAIGQSLAELTRMGYVGTTGDQVSKMLLDAGFWEGTTTYLSQDGKMSYLITAIRYVRDSDRRITGIMTLSKEITGALEKEVLELRHQINKQKVTAQAMVDAQEKERAEIGKELRDNINQILSTTKLYLELAKTDDEERLSLINRSAGNIHTAIREIRNISRSLVPSSIGDLGLIDSLTDLVESIQLNGAIEVELNAMGDFDSRLDEKTKLVLFRIIEEQINNVLRHSGARRLVIELSLGEADNRIGLSLTDDGIGFNPEEMKTKGRGLSNIRGRVDLCGGKMTIRSSPGGGCKLDVQIPVA
jgi:PAS domain S-box-containing protein